MAIGSVPEAEVEGDGHDGHDDHAGHDHKRSIRHQKRSTGYAHKLHKRSADHSAAEQCMNEATLASIYGLDMDVGISRTQFLQLCPALIQQKVGGHCDPLPTTTAAPVEKRQTSKAEIYGYGTIAVVAISLTAVAGGIFIPFLHKPAVQYFLNMFVAMGVATMLSDSLLHLMPVALGLHDHGAHEDHSDHEAGVAEYTIVQLVVCLAIYAFFIFETVMSKLRPQNVTRPFHGHSHDLDLNTKEEESDIGSPPVENGGAQTKASKEALAVTDEKKGNIITPLAVMILVGDGVHNFIDGLAIGAAFSASLQDGLGTSVAIFVHELPHEIGDFAILLSTGMSKGRVILFNLLSASTCLVGMFIGTALSENENVRTWLIAITAGMFIYLSLVDMLPELMAPKKVGKWWIYFLVQNIGMIIGFGLLLIISVYEESLIHLGG